MYKIIETDNFISDKKYYRKKLSKAGYNELEDSLEDLYCQFDQDKFDGDNFFTDIKTNGRAYKLRIGIKSMKLSKSNGMRTIYYAVNEEQEVYMLMLYRKADLDPSTNELKNTVADIMRAYL